MQELLREGQSWLVDGENCSGREQEDNWKDALRLFEEVKANKIGATNYVAWFNIGYLQWKLESAPDKAEESFYQAQRLSARERNIWHTKSLRHQAEMQYLQGKYEEAWATIQRAIDVEGEFDSLYNAARYAAKLGKKDKVSSLLDKCIELRPATIITMFSEADFIE